ncbi:MAG: SDR family NAD(P)-dependent oxidoreductase [Acidimicrobiales bacterium]
MPLTAVRRVALITGSSRGIGEAVARAFSREGYGVALNSSRSRDDGAVLAKQLPLATYLQADVSTSDGAQELVHWTLQQFGRLDVLVNNAGGGPVIPHSDLEAVTPEIWDEVLAINLSSAWHVTRAAAPALAASGDGRVLNISSVAGARAGGSSVPYAVSKAGIDHLTRLLARALAPAVRVNALAPGMVRTALTAPQVRQRSEAAQRAPLQRVGTPEEVAEAALAVVRLDFVTGQILAVDGGLSVT